MYEFLSARIGEWFRTVDAVLRRRRYGLHSAMDLSGADGEILTGRQVTWLVIVCGVFYGAGMGAYAYIVGQRTLWEQLPQMFYSSIKVPLLIGVTMMVALPSFFILNTLLGLRDDFWDALRALISAQAGLTIILASFLPFTLFSYVSLSSAEASYELAVLFNAVMFGAASISAQLLLGAYYRPLVVRNSRHRWMVRVWIFTYGFVGIQAAYILRPFIGSPNAEPTFLRFASFQNAYVKVFQLIWNVIGTAQVPAN